MPFPEDVFQELEKEAILSHYHPRPIIGLYYQLWNQRAKQVEVFIKANNLQPVRFVAPETAKPSGVPVDPGGRFGLRNGPHIHSAGEMYLVTGEQWSQFGQSVLADVGAKLKDASHVPFQSVLELTEVAAGF